MRRFGKLLLPLLLPFVGGCDTGAPLPAGPVQAPVAQVRAGFPPRGIADTIVVDAVERLPLRAAELVGPDGTTMPASYVNVAANPATESGQWAAGNPWRNAVSGGAPVPSTLIPQAGAALQSQERLLANVSTADIPLPDPVAYRRDWAHYRIRLIFGTPPGEVETREIPAPEPPPQ